MGCSQSDKHAAQNDKRELTPEQKDKAQQWLDKHWTGNRQCPICGSKDWRIDPQLGGLPVMGNDGVLVLGTRFPNIVVMCRNCSFVRLFNAVIADILPAKSPDAEPGDGNG